MGMRTVLTGLAGMLLGSMMPVQADMPRPTGLAADIRWTAYGVPHIRAKDERGLGYGIGYAYARDNACLLAEEIVTARGERARYFGSEGKSSAELDNLPSDIFYAWLNQPEALQAFWQAQTPAVRQLLEGYAAGFNRFLREADGKTTSCLGQPWLRAIATDDLLRLTRRLLVEGGVREAVVVARDAASGKQLLGYVVAEDGVDASGLLERLRERLKRDLPEYMVPAHLALLPAMPLTPNGKIDRKALPDIDVTASEAYVAPRNELELALAGIWQEVLGIARIGVHDNFFELGGDSILSMQVVAKARALKKLGFSLKLRDLIQKPSIAALSGYDDSAAPPSPILALNAAVDGCPPLFCVHAGFGTVFDYEPLARRLNGRRSVLAIQARSLLDPNWRDVSLQRMAEDYVALIRQRQAEGPYHLLGWSLGGTLGMLMAAELERQGQQVAFLGLLDSYVPGTEAPAADDWREDLLDFLSVSAGLETRPPLAAGLEQRDNVSAAIAECLGVGQTGKGGLGCDELAQVFLVARQLKQLSGQLDSCSPIQVRPLCWWTRGRGEEVRALSRQLGGQPLAGRVAACGHFQIPHAQEVLDSLVEALEEIHGSLVYS
ncbi:acyl-homoserine lactone acylase PvdQ [Pseudomonas aeruginosa]|nr:acyl-homoserine lactone acylase PvdQ [Pseudomonas aeruginosa]